MGTCNILNVTEGDIKLVFDNQNPAETIRAGRIVKEMLSRGYALLVEVERGRGKKKEKAFERALDFDETKCEYIIADYDPTVAPPEETSGETSQAEKGVPDVPEEVPQAKRGRRKGVPASGTRAYGVARSAGG